MTKRRVVKSVMRCIVRKKNYLPITEFYHYIYRAFCGLDFDKNK